MCPHGELSQATDQADSPSLPAHPLEKHLFSPGSPRNHASTYTDKLAGTGEGAKPPGSYSQRLRVRISYTLLCPWTQMQICVSRVHGSPWGQLFLSPVVKLGRQTDCRRMPLPGAWAMHTGSPRASSTQLANRPCPPRLLYSPDMLGTCI